MNEREYPEAWGVFVNGQWTDEMCGCEDVTNEVLDDAVDDQDQCDEINGDDPTDTSGWHVVQLFAAPEVERRIAEAVAKATRQLDFLMSEARNAERERCKMIAERIKLAPLWDFGTAQAIWDEIESGEQPTTEGGA